MKRTSPSSRLVSIAARSPAFSRTGPEVVLMDTPISLAMILARVVLPRPGGPKINTWSSASWRLRAAEMKISICSATAGWPTYSASRLGRIARSCTSSYSPAWAEIRRSDSIMALPVAGTRLHASVSSVRSRFNCTKGSVAVTLRSIQVPGHHARTLPECHPVGIMFFRARRINSWLDIPSSATRLTALAASCGL